MSLLFNKVMSRVIQNNRKSELMHLLCSLKHCGTDPSGMFNRGNNQ